MSKEAIQAVVRELEMLPDTDQRLVLAFLARLRHDRHAQPTAASTKGATLRTHGGLLIFTGQLEQPDMDWVQQEREERLDALMQAALGSAAHS